MTIVYRHCQPLRKSWTALISKVQVHYALETQPAKDLLKEHGFVLRK